MSTGSTAPQDILSMSDEDFFKMGVPPIVKEEAPADAPPAQDPQDPPAADPLVPGETPPEEDPADPPADEQPKNPLEQADDQLGAPPAKPGTEAPAADPVADPKPAADPAPGSETPAPAADPVADPATGDEPDYKALYLKMMAPFKANGKQIDLRSPEEAIGLMQMGANFTRKMQEIAPHRKVLAMLENNGLLDEGKLSFLIDLDKKDPDAIKKLVKDAGIDPMDIDTSAEPAYRGGNHRVSDDEVNFRSQLDELGSNPAGRETLQDINTRWDQASKDALWKQPGIMSVIHAQRESGVYAQIVEEMDRQKTLGQLPANTSFLQAYQTVGEQLHNAGRFTPKEPAPAPAPTPEPAPVVATRVAAPKPTVANGDKASAAAPSRSTSRKPAQEFVNPLSMSDDDFLKHMKNRL